MDVSTRERLRCQDTVAGAAGVLYPGQTPTVHQLVRHNGEKETLHKTRPDIQGLKAVSVGALLLFHFYPECFVNGFLGVDIFFVISGYLLFTSFSRQIACRHLCRSTVAEYYSRRAVSLLPLSTLYVVCAVLVFSCMAVPEDIQDAQVAALRAYFFSTNVYAILEQSDYFQHILEDHNLFTHLWSLAVIAQFCLIASVLFIIRRCFVKEVARFVFPVMALASFALFLSSPRLTAFNFMPARLWQFLLITIFEEKILCRSSDEASDPLLNADKLEEGPTDSSTRISCSLSLCCLLLPFLPVLKGDALIGRVILTIATAVIITYGDANKETSLLSLPPLVFLGDLSFCLFLFHWPFVIYIARRSDLLSSYRPLALAATVITAALVHHAFERRCRVSPRKRVFLVWTCLSMLALGLVLAAPQLNTAARARLINPFDPEQVLETNQRAMNHDRAHPRKGVEYDPWLGFARPEGLAHWPNGTGQLRFAVIGNGYAEDQNILVWKAFREHYSTFDTFYQEACEVLSYTRRVRCRHRANYSEALDRIRPDVTFVIQRYFLPKTDALPAEEGQADRALEEMLEHLRAIEDKSSLFFVLNAIPSVFMAEMARVNEMLREGVAAAEINKRVVHKDDTRARLRIARLMLACPKCRLYDIKPALADAQNATLAVDLATSLAIFNPHSRLTPYGLSRVQDAYNQIAVEYSDELQRLADELYPSTNSTTL